MTPFRKAAGVPYPHAYASQEQIAAASTPSQKHALVTFNAAQRAHANFTENVTVVVVGGLIAGLEYPRAAAGIVLAWSVNRVLYSVGYTRDAGKGRYWGGLSLILEKVVPFLAGKAAWNLAMR